jgi:hypothetical protein
MWTAAQATAEAFSSEPSCHGDCPSEVELLYVSGDELAAENESIHMMSEYMISKEDYFEDSVYEVERENPKSILKL